MRINEKKQRGKNWKSFCNKKTCEKCDGLFFVNSANRYCYEDRYDLPQVPRKIIYKLNGQVNIVATGVVGHASYSKNNSNDGGGDLWEENVFIEKPKNDDNYLYAVKETCNQLNVSFERFMEILNKIIKEMFDEANSNGD